MNTASEKTAFKISLSIFHTAVEEERLNRVPELMREEYAKLSKDEALDKLNNLILHLYETHMQNDYKQTHEHLAPYLILINNEQPNYAAELALQKIFEDHIQNLIKTDKPI